MKRDAVEFRQWACAGVVADNERNLAVEFAGLVAVEQVGIAMQVLRDEDRQACDGGGEFQAPVHTQLGGDGLEVRSEGVHAEAVERPFDAHEEEAGFVVLMLIGMDDVGAVLVKHAGNGCHEALSLIHI